ncbi:type II toxin-antitoxin system VapC family toxin [Cyanobacterium aponinum UTEX 3222]|uniref:type II toxin-antitoxin system VapC family toxin n=1 Tax=Cyanobacterium aponinum TaxID=379064 RepID=UPI002B4BCBF1|nr:type II toxin-antitoxin system VapC family toxin [Cyanobacterium aponinum]WRL39612.1 type II toxin-antitoxin system VapC family toxin [Cyanobacterium aponinum UTEX 3221]WRL42394.1 type II toxin-antitoxin system VapC family toxin [Cyanobacterium aponinum UTEX 3222]
MKLDYLIDTNIFICLINEELIEAIPNGILGYSIITQIELLSFPLLEKEEENLIKRYLNTLSEIPLNKIIAEKTIYLRRKYNLKTPDAIILATAWECQSVLLSNDQKLTNIKEVSVISLKTKN